MVLSNRMKQIDPVPLAEHVAFVPGYAFMVDIHVKQSSMRLNYSALPVEKLTEGVRRLGNLLQQI